MYGHLEFQQQLMAGIFARQPKAPPTSAEYFLSRLGKTEHFCDLKKEPYHFGEFGFQDEQAYLALEPAEYINSAGYDELLLLRTKMKMYPIHNKKKIQFICNDLEIFLRYQQFLEKKKIIWFEDN